MAERMAFETLFCSWGLGRPADLNKSPRILALMYHTYIHTYLYNLLDIHYIFFRPSAVRACWNITNYAPQCLNVKTTTIQTLFSKKATPKIHAVAIQAGKISFTQRLLFQKAFPEIVESFAPARATKMCCIVNSTSFVLSFFPKRALHEYV